MSIEDTLARFLDDRQVDREGGAAFVAHLRADSGFASEVRDLLLVEEAITRALGVRPQSLRDRIGRAMSPRSGRSFVRVVAQRVHIERQRRQRRMVVFAGLFTVAVAAAAVVLVLIRPPAGSIAPSSSSTLSSPSLASSPTSTPSVAIVARLVTGSAGMGAPVRRGDRLTEDAVVRWPDGTEATLRSARVVVGGGPGEAPALRIEHGKVDLVVASQPAGRIARFATPAATAEVLGTRLSLRVDTGATTLSVDEGRVRLVRATDGVAVMVAPGQRSTMAAADRGAVGVVLDDFTTPILSPRWALRSRGGAEVNFRRAVDPDGTGWLAITSQLTSDGWFWLGQAGPAQDWSGFSGIGLTLVGDGSGATYTLELNDGSAAVNERLAVAFRDDQPGRRRLVMTWKDFRHCPYNEPSAPDDGLQTRAIYGFGLMRNDGDVSASCAMRFERVELIGARSGE